jgi:hypothetical protein
MLINNNFRRMRVQETPSCVLTLVSIGRCSFKFIRKPEEAVEAANALT